MTPAGQWSVLTTPLGGARRWGMVWVMIPSQIIEQLERIRWPHGWRLIYPVEPGVGVQLERQLLRELGDEHALYQVRHAITCLARRDDDDDALYWIEGAAQPFALVHLTWYPGPGPNPLCPWTVCFTTLSEALAPDDQGSAG